MYTSPDRRGSGRLTLSAASCILRSVPSVRRLAAVVAVLTFAASGWVQCAGWQPTAAARRACCTSGQCPKHRSSANPTRRNAVVTQAQADNCCAAGERGSSIPSASSSVVNAPAAVLVSIPALEPDLSRVHERTPRAPSQSPPVTRHLLLSVFLI